MKFKIDITVIILNQKYFDKKLNLHKNTKYSINTIHEQMIDIQCVNLFFDDERHNTIFLRLFVRICDCVFDWFVENRKWMKLFSTNYELDSAYRNCLIVKIQFDVIIFNSESVFENLSAFLYCDFELFNRKRIDHVTTAEIKRFFTIFWKKRKHCNLYINEKTTRLEKTKLVR